METGNLHEIEVRYSEPLVREAVRAHFRRQIREELLDFKFIAAVTLALGGLGWLWWSGDDSWLFGFLVAVAVLLPVIVVSVYVARYRESVNRFRRLKDPRARFVFREADLTVTSELGSFTVSWSAIIRLWQFPRFWFLFLSKAQYVTLPTDGLEESTLSFVRSKVMR